MDIQRLVLSIALVLVLLLLWQAWQQDYGTPPQRAERQEPTAVSTAPAATSEPAADVPPAPTAATTQGSPAVGATAQPAGRVVHVRTDVLDVQIDPRGGVVRQADLPEYPVSTELPQDPFRLLYETPAILYIAQSGLLGAKGAPDHNAQLTPEAWDYTLPAGDDELQVRLRWQGADGVAVVKTFTFHRGAYLVDVDYDLDNGSPRPWSVRMYAQLQRTEAQKSRQTQFIYTYTGGAISTPEERYDKITFSEMADKPLKRDAKGGWVAMVQHYFISAWIPSQAATNHYYTRVVDGPHYIIGLMTPTIRLEAGSHGHLGSRLFMGPKLQDRLAKIAPALDLTADYGPLWFIAQPLFQGLKLIHHLVGNWGWAIIILTILIKLAFYKLSATSYRSMAKMRRVQPRMAALKERYGGDRQKMNQALMELYKKEKINPLGGCLPVVVQIPVFISLYWVLLETVQLRQAPFMFWINDLSIKDPYFVLPILMGITMLVQTKLNPTPMDPMQAKVMMLMPLFFTVFFAFFPSGLVLYWIVNNLLSISQQWYITHKIVDSPEAPA